MTWTTRSSNIFGNAITHNAPLQLSPRESPDRARAEQVVTVQPFYSCHAPPAGTQLFDGEMTKAKRESSVVLPPNNRVIQVGFERPASAFGIAQARNPVTSAGEGPPHCFALTAHDLRGLGGICECWGCAVGTTIFIGFVPMLCSGVPSRLLCFVLSYGTLYLWPFLFSTYLFWITGDSVTCVCGIIRRFTEEKKMSQHFRA